MNGVVERLETSSFKFWRFFSVQQTIENKGDADLARTELGRTSSFQKFGSRQNGHR
jgi:hypothetical protein